MEAATIDGAFLQIMLTIIKVAVLSLLLERGLHLVFYYRYLRDFLPGKGLKAPISLLVAWAICNHYEFDAVASVLDPSNPTALGIFVTATIVAGGSAGAVVLARRIFDVVNSANKN